MEKWEIDIKLGVFKVQEIREMLEGLRVKNIRFLLQPFEKNG